MIRLITGSLMSDFHHMRMSCINLPEIIQTPSTKTPQITVGEVAIGIKKNMPENPANSMVSGLIFFDNPIFTKKFF